MRLKFAQFFNTAFVIKPWAMKLRVVSTALPGVYEGNLLCERLVDK
jgi:hypothetical protein